MQTNEEHRRRMSEMACGRTVKSLEWEPEGMYWVMTFDNDAKLCFVTTAEMSGSAMAHPDMGRPVGM